ncbi:MAG: sodium:proton antiporter NhaD [Chitinophagales bacterium]|nr:sodium:proton antiporter NhaD [Chitinophagales bacterium]
MGVEIILLLLIFCVGYAAIIFEHNIGIDKAAAAVITGVAMWTLMVFSEGIEVTHRFEHVIPEIAGILFFIIGAMTIVEIIDLHNGFIVITNFIKTDSKKKFLWIVAIISFLCGAILDNLTTAIVMVSLLRKIVDNKEERMLLAGIVVIAANAGGSFSPIGNVTTTLLWVGGQITPLKVFLANFIPGLICLVVPVFVLSFSFKGKMNIELKVERENLNISTKTSTFIFWYGVALLLFVPIFKTLTHLPPFMGMLFSLGIFWFTTDLLHKKSETATKKELSVYRALENIDLPSVIFFFGILSAVAALQEAGILRAMAQWMDTHIGNYDLITFIIGLLSAVVDNVPLVAATQGMYSIQQFAVDSHFWHFIAYCAGVGGSILVIGSAAGVAAMGIEKLNFIWYAKRIGWLAFLGYAAGAIYIVLMKNIIP